MPDFSAGDVKRGRAILKLLELHHRQQGEARAAQRRLARSTGARVNELLVRLDPEQIDAIPPAEGTGLDDSDWPALHSATRLARSLPRQLVDAITAKLPESLASEFERELYSFEALPSLPAQSVQRIIQRADKRQLAIALLGADEAIFDAVTSNMSARAATMLREDMESLLASGELRTRDVHDARAALSSVIQIIVGTDR